MHEGSCMRRVAREDGWPWWWVRMEVAEGVYRKADIGLLRKTKTGFFEERISGGAAGGRLGASRDFLERRPQETLRVGDTQKMRRDRGEHAEASS